MKPLFLFGILIVMFSVISFTPALAIPVNAPNFRLLDITSSNKNIYLVYDHHGLYFTNSLDEGLTFEQPLKLNNPNYIWLGLARIATAENNVYISWQGKAVNSSNDQVLFTRSTDGGRIFTSPIIISKNDTDSQLLQLVSIENHVYVTYGTYDNISFRSSSDNGTTFGRSIDLLPNTIRGAAALSQVQIHATDDGKTIYVIGEYFPDCLTFSTTVCTDQIFFEKSKDFGATFSVPKIIYSTHQYIQELHTYVSEKNMYLAWGENSHAVNFMKSTDGGKTFSMPKDLIKTIFVGRTNYPGGIGLAANKGNVYVIWGYVSYDYPPSLFLIRSVDEGNTFVQPMNLTENYGYGTFDVTASSNSVYLTWSSYQHRSEKTDTLFRKSDDNGTNFGQILNLTSNLNESSSMPILISRGNNVYVGWGTVFPGDDLLIGTSNDNGTTFKHFINLAHVSQTTLPEFQFALPVLLTGIVSLIVFYRMRYRLR